MTPAETVALIIGPFYVVVSVGLMVNAEAYRRMIEEYLQSPALAYLGGIMALLFGLLILVSHNSWNADWTVIITILGWLAAAKGALLIIAPKSFGRLTKVFMAATTRLRYVAAVALLFGLHLTLKGFGVV